MSQVDNEVSFRDLIPNKIWVIQTLFLAGIYTITMLVYQPVSTIVKGVMPSNAMAEKMEMLDKTMDELGLEPYQVTKGKRK